MNFSTETSMYSNHYSGANAPTPYGYPPIPYNNTNTPYDASCSSSQSGACTTDSRPQAHTYVHGPSCHGPFCSGASTSYGAGTSFHGASPPNHNPYYTFTGPPLGPPAPQAQLPPSQINLGKPAPPHQGQVLAKKKV